MHRHHCALAHAGTPWICMHTKKPLRRHASPVRSTTSKPNKNGRAYAPTKTAHTRTAASPAFSPCLQRTTPSPRALDRVPAPQGEPGEDACRAASRPTASSTTCGLCVVGLMSSSPPAPQTSTFAPAARSRRSSCASRWDASGARRQKQADRASALRAGLRVRAACEPRVVRRRRMGISFAGP